MKRFCLLFVFLLSFEMTSAQEEVLQERISVIFQETKIKEALSIIEQTLDIHFIYPSLLLQNNPTQVNRSFDQTPLAQVIREIFPNKKLNLEVRGRRIHIIEEKQKRKSILNGYIRDRENGEALVGALVRIHGLPSIGTYSNDYGYYSLNIPEGQYEIFVSYYGFISQSIKINLTQNQRLNIDLKPDTTYLPEVVITSQSASENIRDTRMGYHQIKLQTLKKLPVLGGEPDILKMTQYLPGVKSAGEGSSGLYVRGGNIDQNLILLDEAPIYNPTHLLGFFSTFNADAIRHAELFKAGFPVEHGGRLSSVLDLKMKEGNREQLGIKGGIGLMASRIFIEGPIQTEKSSFMVSARRTYPDLVLKLMEDNGGNKFHFYDFNGKINVQLDPNNHLFFSAYNGQDKFRFFDKFENTWGNTTASLRWNHLINSRMFTQVSLVYSKYQYVIDNILDGRPNFTWETGISDLNSKVAFNAYLTPRHHLTFGLNTIFHRINPGKELNLPSSSQSKTLETALYLGHQWKIHDKFQVNYGIRLNLYQNLGPATLFSFQNTDPFVDSMNVNGIYHSFFHPMLRLSLRYLLNDNNSVKASFSQTVQYQQELRNSVSPFNSFYIWLASNPNIPAQKADHLSLGYYVNLNQNMFRGSIELYYKWLYNQIDFVDHAILFQNPYLEREIRAGNGRAYGIEFMLEKVSGKLNGWINYTYARSLRTIEGINEGKTYPAYYDLPHEVGITLTYEVSPRWTLAANWQYTTGKAVNLPTGSFQFGNAIIPLYEGRNSARLPDYHRLDISASIKNRQHKSQRWQSNWVIGIQNVYNRKNALSIDILPYRDPSSGNVPNDTEVAAYKTYIFGIIPSISYNFEF